MIEHCRATSTAVSSESPVSIATRMPTLMEWVLIQCFFLVSDTGQDPDRIFPDPDPEILNFWYHQDFSGFRIFPDLS
jgi:hypothetical protein